MYVCNCNGGITESQFDGAVKAACGDKRPIDRKSRARLMGAALRLLEFGKFPCGRCADDMVRRISDMPNPS